MYKILCKKKNSNKSAFVFTLGKNIGFTSSEDKAMVFSNMQQCKNIRDDLLEVSDKVTILKL